MAFDYECCELAATAPGTCDRCDDAGRRETAGRSFVAPMAKVKAKRSKRRRNPVVDALLAHLDYLHQRDERLFGALTAGFASLQEGTAIGPPDEATRLRARVVEQENENLFLRARLRMLAEGQTNQLPAPFYPWDAGVKVTAAMTGPSGVTGPMGPTGPSGLTGATGPRKPS